MSPGATNLPSLTSKTETGSRSWWRPQISDRNTDERNLFCLCRINCCCLWMLVVAGCRLPALQGPSPSSSSRCNLRFFYVIVYRICCSFCMIVKHLVAWRFRVAIEVLACLRCVQWFSCQIWAGRLVICKKNSWGHNIIAEKLWYMW